MLSFPVWEAPSDINVWTFEVSWLRRMVQRMRQRHFARTHTSVASIVSDTVNLDVPLCIFSLESTFCIKCNAWEQSLSLECSVKALLHMSAGEKKNTCVKALELFLRTTHRKSSLFAQASRGLRPSLARKFSRTSIIWSFLNSRAFCDFLQAQNACTQLPDRLGESLTYIEDKRALNKRSFSRQTDKQVVEEWRFLPDKILTSWFSISQDQGEAGFFCNVCLTWDHFTRFPQSSFRNDALSPPVYGVANEIW